MNDLEEKIKEQRRALQKLEDDLENQRRKEAEERTEPLKTLVERAHACLCQWNHTDGCGWGYEGNNWEAWSHARWLEHYDRLINGDRYTPAKASLADVETIISAVEELKSKVSVSIWLLRHHLTP